LNLLPHFYEISHQQRTDRMEALAEELALPRAELEGNPSCEK
jgi:hypothetical protein